MTPRIFVAVMLVLVTTLAAGQTQVVSETL